MGRPQADGAGEPLGSPAAEAQVTEEGVGEGVCTTGEGGRGEAERDCSGDFRDFLPSGFSRKAKNCLLFTGPRAPPPPPPGLRDREHDGHCSVSSAEQEARLSVS